MTAPAFLLSAFFPAIVIFAAIRDVTTFTIPNWLSLAAVAVFLPTALLAHMPLSVLEASALVGVVALMTGVLMFALGWIGGGDAKLFAASALWLGFPAVFPFLLWTALAGGALAVTLLWSRKLIAGAPAFGPPWFGRLMEPKGDVPYGLAIAIGALAAFPSSAVVAVLAHPPL